MRGEALCPVVSSFCLVTGKLSEGEAEENATHTLNKGCVTRGPGDEVLWPAERYRFQNGIANLPWVCSELSTPQSLTHSAVARGPI